MASRREENGKTGLKEGPATGRGQALPRTRLFYLAMALILGGVLVASKMMEPSRLPNLCLPDMLFGVPCITSGLTRAFHAISLAQFGAALAYHPLSLLLYGVMVLHLIMACLRLLGWKTRLIKISNPVQVMGWGTIGLLVVFWIPRVLGVLPTP